MWPVHEPGEASQLSAITYLVEIFESDNGKPSLPRVVHAREIAHTLQGRHFRC